MIDCIMTCLCHQHQLITYLTSYFQNLIKMLTEDAFKKMKMTHTNILWLDHLKWILIPNLNGTFEIFISKAIFCQHNINIYKPPPPTLYLSRSRCLVFIVHFSGRKLQNFECWNLYGYLRLSELFGARWIIEITWRNGVSVLWNNHHILPHPIWRYLFFLKCESRIFVCSGVCLFWTIAR